MVGFGMGLRILINGRPINGRPIKGRPIKGRRRSCFPILVLASVSCLFLAAGCGESRRVEVVGDPYFTLLAWEPGEKSVSQLLGSRGYEGTYRSLEMEADGEWDALVKEWTGNPPSAVLVSPLWAGRAGWLRERGIDAAVLGESRSEFGVEIRREDAFRQAGEWLAAQMDGGGAPAGRAALVFYGGTPRGDAEMGAFREGWRRASVQSGGAEGGADSGDRRGAGGRGARSRPEPSFFTLRRDREKEDLRRFLKEEITRGTEWFGLFAGRFNGGALEILGEEPVFLVGEGSEAFAADERFRGAVVLPLADLVEAALMAAEGGRDGPAEVSARWKLESSPYD